ncbi:hypothetical protein [uncultured Draconibacterium sp.]|uniref:hypothetical protein n=1 Tax=uncultured Draconibacterium sp. TaxID=1573823 RepID=UPI0025E65E99|nr:hypothetical protein [uncultured Draconibacterium sp.]
MNLETSLVQVKANNDMKKINKMSDQEIIAYLTNERNKLVLPQFNREYFREYYDLEFTDEQWEEFGDEYVSGYLEGSMMEEMIKFYQEIYIF